MHTFYVAGTTDGVLVKEVSTYQGFHCIAITDQTLNFPTIKTTSIYTNTDMGDVPQGEDGDADADGAGGAGGADGGAAN